MTTPIAISPVETLFAANTDSPFTMTLQPQTDPGVRTWVYRPTDTSTEREKGQAGLVVLRALFSRLPPKTLVVSELSEYPVVLSAEKAYSVGVGADLMPVSKREYFIIGGIGFFRRYSDDWNPRVVCSINGSWSYSIGGPELQRIYVLVASKGPSGVTYQDLLPIVRGY